VNGPHDGRVTDRAVVDEYTVDGRHRIQKPAILDLGHCLVVRRAVLLGLDVVVEDLRIIPEPALDLRANDRRDLLRRPGRSSSPGEAIRRTGDVVDLDNDWLSHGFLPLSDAYGAAGARPRAHAASGAFLLQYRVPVGAGVKSARDGDDSTPGAHAPCRASG